jgi:hypothetical protein
VRALGFYHLTRVCERLPSGPTTGSVSPDRPAILGDGVGPILAPGPKFAALSGLPP